MAGHRVKRRAKVNFNCTTTIGEKAIMAVIYGDSLSNRLYGTPDNDFFYGGGDMDMVLFSSEAYLVRYHNGLHAISKEGLDYLHSDIEYIKDASGDTATPYVSGNVDYGAYQLAAMPSWSPLEYIASYADLCNAFGPNSQAGLSHAIATSASEARPVPFNGLDYIASYSDLIAAFGANEDAGAAHFIAAGRFEGRHVEFHPCEYLASYADLQQAFVGKALFVPQDPDAAAVHYINAGHKEGREITFNGLEYVARVDRYGAYDLFIQGANLDYVSEWGAQKALDFYARYGHTVEDKLNYWKLEALNYIASYDDLIQAFHNQIIAGTDPRDLGSYHYIMAGAYEGRDTLGMLKGAAEDLFDAGQYLANYADLQIAFGHDTDAATLHYITQGYFEGRTDDPPT